MCPVIKNLLGKISENIRKKSDKKEAIYQALLEKLRNDENYRLIYAMQEQSYLLKAIQLLLFTVIFWGFFMGFTLLDIDQDPNLFYYILKYTSAIIGNITLFVSMRFYMLSTEVRNSLTKIHSL